MNVDRSGSSRGRTERPSGEASGAEHIGSGLRVSDGRGYSTRPQPTAFPLPSGRWRAEISGVENGAVIRSWIGPDFATKAAAIAEATRKALGREAASPAPVPTQTRDEPK